MQVRKYKTFLEDFAGQLLDIEDALDESLGDAWDISLDPIALETAPHEQASLADLIQTDNKVFNKVMTVLVSLCVEIADLKREAESKFYAPLLLYGDGEEASEGSSNDDDPSTGDSQLQIGRMLPFLQRLSVFADRVHLVVKNVVQQLAALYSPRSTPQTIDVREVHLDTIFRYLGDALTVLITLDEIVESNTGLKEHWLLYKRMMKAVRNNEKVFDVSREQLAPFEQWVLTLESRVLDGCLFHECIEQVDFLVFFDTKSLQSSAFFSHRPLIVSKIKVFDDVSVSVTANTVFREEFTLSIRLMHAYLEPRLGEVNERTHRSQFVGLCGLFVFHHQLFRVVDKRLVKAIWDVQKKVPAVFLYGNIVLTPNEMLLRKIPQLASLVEKKYFDYNAVRRGYLERMDSTIAVLAQSYYMNVCTWMVTSSLNYLQPHSCKI